MKAIRKNLQKQKGQGTIEFIFVFIAFIFFLSLSYNVVVSFAVYQYFSYATFMTARAYQASRETPEDQLEAAKRTMAIYLPNVQPGSGSTPFGFSQKKTLATIIKFTAPTTPADAPRTPFGLEFQVPLVSIPLGEDLKREFGTITLKTESRLGREPTQKECQDFFKTFFSKFGSGGGLHSSDGMEDNGC